MLCIGLRLQQHKGTASAHWPVLVAQGQQGLLGSFQPCCPGDQRLRGAVGKRKRLPHVQALLLLCLTSNCKRSWACKRGQLALGHAWAAVAHSGPSTTGHMSTDPMLPFVDASHAASASLRINRGQKSMPPSRHHRGSRIGDRSSSCGCHLWRSKCNVLVCFVNLVVRVEGIIVHGTCRQSSPGSLG